jgi:hypothetical protein
MLAGFLAGEIHLHSLLIVVLTFWLIFIKIFCISCAILRKAGDKPARWNVAGF